MHGFSSHAYMWYTENEEYVWVKYHFLTKQGIKNFTDEESIKVAENPDYTTEDLYNSIENGGLSSSGCFVQIMTNEEAKITNLIHLT